MPKNKVEKNEKVMKMVKATLAVDPDIRWATLKERAEELDPSIKDLSAQAFNARYPLQVVRPLGKGSMIELAAKRARRKTEAAMGTNGASPEGEERRPKRRRPQGKAEEAVVVGEKLEVPTRPTKRKKRKAEANTAGRDVTRRTLLLFAEELATATNKTAFIKALTSVESYVDLIDEAYRQI